MPNHSKSLVLNSDFNPLAVIGWQKAIVLDFKNVVSIVDTYKGDFIVCSSGHKWPVPAVVVLKKYISKRPVAAFSKKNLLLRDRMLCMYCGERFRSNQLTYDHVIPKSKWVGNPRELTSWTNVVSCCNECNTKKADKTLEEAKMSLIRQPTKPNFSNFVIGLAPWSLISDEWRPYLPKFYLDMHDENIQYERHC